MASLWPQLRCAAVILSRWKMPQMPLRCHMIVQGLAMRLVLRQQLAGMIQPPHSCGASRLTSNWLCLTGTNRRVAILGLRPVLSTNCVPIWCFLVRIVNDFLAPATRSVRSRNPHCLMCVEPHNAMAPKVAAGSKTCLYHGTDGPVVISTPGYRWATLNGCLEAYLVRSFGSLLTANWPWVRS